jgi:DNA-binding NarL/FixJ family response regulator
MARVRALILVADRNELVAEALRDAFLELIDADVQIATSLGQAILTVQRIPPDLVLVDAWISNSGIKHVVRQIKECSPDSKVFVMASHCDSALEQRARLVGATACYEKETVPGRVGAMLASLGTRS